MVRTASADRGERRGAAGHSQAVVTLLGGASPYFGALLPGRVDPLMERVVDATLVILGLCVFYSPVRYRQEGGKLRPRRRSMLLFAGVRRGWYALQH